MPFEISDTALYTPNEIFTALNIDVKGALASGALKSVSKGGVTLIQGRDLRAWLQPDTNPGAAPSRR